MCIHVRYFIYPRLYSLGASLYHCYLVYSLSVAFHSDSVMFCLILLHLFACCIILIVVKPIIHQARTVVNAFLEEYASDKED